MAEHFVLTEAVYYILLSLYTPLHGYGIMQNTEIMSDGRVHLAAGTLYGALNTLLDKQWITALPGEESSRQKRYLITASGKTAVGNELLRLHELIRHGESMVGGEIK